LLLTTLFDAHAQTKCNISALSLCSPANYLLANSLNILGSNVRFMLYLISACSLHVITFFSIMTQYSYCIEKLDMHEYLIRWQADFYLVCPQNKFMLLKVLSLCHVHIYVLSYT
jgi:cellobiose-specific phosphotransferase system component IIB